MYNFNEWVLNYYSNGTGHFGVRPLLLHYCKFVHEGLGWAKYKFDLVSHNNIVIEAHYAYYRK